MNLYQILKFTGGSGTLGLTPDVPVDAVLDNGTSVHFTSLYGRYKASPGGVTITLEKPLPNVVVHKLFLKIGANIMDFQYTPPPELTVGTSEGRYRISLEEIQ